MKLVCLLEERSAKEVLKVILPRILPQGVLFETYAFEGKRDLKRKLQHHIQYWQGNGDVFLVLMDQDGDDCVAAKDDLVEIIKKTGKAGRTLVRIACHELKNFFLGDLAAVEQGLSIRGLSEKQGMSKYRAPDKLANAPDELKKLTKNEYSKISGSRRIAPFLKIDGSSRSTSFNNLVRGIKKLVEG
ncbi:MAG: DUF4276 family protein [Synergistales bacterium]|nr:DUF4276 family protein [Synergistales bacterium]